MTRDQALLRALRDKVNIGCFCLTASLSAALASWLTLMMGTLVLSGLLLWSTDRHRRRIQCHPPRIPEGATYDHGMVRSAMEAIADAQKERLDALDACPESMIAPLDGLMTTAAQAETAAIGLARRTDDLHRYLSTKDLGRVRARLYAAQESGRSARTSPERESYEAAASAYEHEAETLSAIDLGVRVAIARLENIRATLQAVPPRIVKLRTANAELSDASYMRLSRDVRAAGSDLDETENHLHAFAQANQADARIDASLSGAFGLRIAIGQADEEPETLRPEEAFGVIRRGPDQLGL